MSRYCIYLRKSRADLEAEAHGEGETLSRHKTALLELARRMNITISATYEEIVSGETIAARPQMQRLLSEVGAGEWDGVLVMEIERLARGDTMDQGLVAQTFKYSGTKIITPLKTYDPQNEFDEEYFEFGLFMARREFTTTNRRLVRGREASAKEGKYVGSVPPYGYRKVKIPNDKGFTLEIIEEQAKVVRMIFEWYADGAEVNGQKKRLGPHAIAVRLNELGIKSVAGKDYWTIYGVQHMLINPVYIGKIRWGYRKVKKTVTPEGQKKSRVFAKEGDYFVVDGLHEPILSEELFYKVQELISANPPTPVKYLNKNVNPFAGIIYCAKCGHAITYRCATGRQSGAYLGCNTPGCTNVSSLFPLVEKRVLSMLGNWVNDYSVNKAQVKHEVNLDEELTKAIAQSEKEIESLQAQLDNVYSFFERGTYTEKIFKQRSSAIEQQITEISERIDRLKSEHQQVIERQKVQAEFVPSIKRLLEIYDTLEPVDKNKWLKQIVERIVYEKDGNGSYRGIDPDCFTLGILPRLPRNGK
ncbi:MAG: recombinase family protein [Oscillospiraceae bacterium]